MLLVPPRLLCLCHEISINYAEIFVVFALYSWPFLFPLCNILLAVLFKFVCIFYLLGKQHFTRDDFLFWKKSQEKEYHQPFSGPLRHSIQLFELIPFWAILSDLCLPILYAQVSDIFMHIYTHGAAAYANKFD